MMVYGHATSALLATHYRTGAWYDAWLFQRGLTSALFLLLSGFAFSVATARHWPVHLRVSSAVVRRVRRFALFVVLGYALHFPVPDVTALARATDAQWQSFLAVDVLQLIGVTFLLVQALVMLFRSRRLFTVMAFALAAAVTLWTPAAWSIDWQQRLPLSVASYLSPSSGSLFPLFPTAAYVLIGAGIGQLYARWGAAHLASFATWAMLVPGAALLALTLFARTLPFQIFGNSEWNWVPDLVFLRTGACLLLLGLVAHGSRYIAHLPHVFGAVAQESLLVYFIHLCIVYGSTWNPGLSQVYGEALSAGPTGLIALALVAAMTVAAWQWNVLKHARPHVARRLSYATGIALVLPLLAR